MVASRASGGGDKELSEAGTIGIGVGVGVAVLIGAVGVSKWAKSRGGA